jgi:hypothetical protein
VSEPAQPASARAATAAAYGLVLVLSLLLAVWSCFLVPLRVGELVLPVAHVAVVAGNLALGLTGGRLVGRGGAAGPGAVWLAVAMTLGSRRAEGDLVVPGTGAGTAYLALGALAAAVAYGLSRGRRPQALHPPG